MSESTEKLLRQVLIKHEYIVAGVKDTLDKASGRINHIITPDMKEMKLLQTTLEDLADIIADRKSVV